MRRFKRYDRDLIPILTWLHYGKSLVILTRVICMGYNLASGNSNNGFYELEDERDIMGWTKVHSDRGCPEMIIYVETRVEFIKDIEVEDAHAEDTHVEEPTDDDESEDALDLDCVIMSFRNACCDTLANLARNVGSHNIDSI